MRESIRDAIHQLSRDADSANIHQPLNMAKHRQQLERAIREGWERYPELFEYPKAAYDYARAADMIEISAKQLVSQPLLDAVLNHLAKGRISYTLALIRSDDDFSNNQREMNGTPSRELLTDASLILANSLPAEQSADVPAEGLRTRIQAALRNYGLSQWRVELYEDMAARVSVSGPQRRVRIRTGSAFTAHAVDRLLVHEVGGHVLRWANASAQPEALASVALGDQAIETEEGLAAALEGRFGLHDPAVLRTYACRVIAVHEAETGGLIAVARRLMDHLPMDQAIELAIRVKRGLVDPNSPGGATKDYGYLAGLRHIERLPASSRTALHSTKWALSLLPVAEELAAEGSIHAATMVPNALQLGITSGR
jgi:hypothetical protein